MTPSEIPQCPECMQTSLPTPLHHLIIALLITRNEDDLGSPALPRLLQQLHAIWPTASLLRIPEDHAFGLDMLFDEGVDCGTEGAFLVGADPDQEPVGRLDAGGECGTNARSCADADSASVHGGGVADTS